MISDRDLIAIYLQTAKGLECDLECFYLDSRNIPTIGVGHKVADSGQPLPKNQLQLMKNLKMHFLNGSLATDEDIINDYNLTINHKFPSYFHSPQKWREITKIRPQLSQDAIASLVVDYNQQTLHDLRTTYPQFPNFPLTIQLVMLDMAFQSGVGYLTGHLDEKHKGFAINRLHYSLIRVAIENQNWTKLKAYVSDLDIFLVNKKWVGENRHQWRIQALELAVNWTSKPHDPDLWPNATHPRLHDPSLAHYQFDFKHLNASIQNNWPLGWYDIKNYYIPTIPIETITANPTIVSSLTYLKTSCFLQLHSIPQKAWIITGFSGEESISQTFQFYFTTYLYNDRLDATFIGSNVTLTINDAQGAPLRYINGIVNAFREQATLQRGWRQTILSVVPMLWASGLIVKSQIFHQQTTLQILQLVLQQNVINAQPVMLDTQSLHPLPQRKYTIQYHESALNFIQRLLEEEGIYYYFQHEPGKHTLVLSNSISGYKRSTTQLTYTGTRDLQGNTLHCKNSSRLLVAEFNSVSGQRDNAMNCVITPTSKTTTSLLLEKKISQTIYRGWFDNEAHEQHWVTCAAEAEAASSQWIEGHSTNPLLSPGTIFTLAEYPEAEQSNQYTPTHLRHYGHDNTFVQAGQAPQSLFIYHNGFSALKANVITRPRLATPRPIINGVLSAQVMSKMDKPPQNIDTDVLGKVLVRFHWDENSQGSLRIPIARRVAGNHRTLTFPPQVGDEALVAFENGNPEQPVIIGFIHNQTNQPPHNPAIHSRVRGFKTQAHELQIDDKKDAEKIAWSCARDFRVDVINNDTVTVKQGKRTTVVKKGSSLLTAAKSIACKVGSNSLVINQDGIYFNGEEIQFKR